MFIFVLLAILLLALFWQYILAGLGLWVLVHVMRSLITWTVAESKPNYRRQPIQARPGTIPVQARPVARPLQIRPVSGPVQPRPAARAKPPAPARELPVPDYLPRWTAGRRLDAGREHAEWQRKFDSTGQ
jgi:hypothetical protein